MAYWNGRNLKRDLRKEVKLVEFCKFGVNFDPRLGIEYCIFEDVANYDNRVLQFTVWYYNHYQHKMMASNRIVFSP